MQKLYQGLCLFSAFALLGCNVSNRILSSDADTVLEKNIIFQSGKAQGETKTLASWWSYFGDETLDSLVQSAVNLQNQTLRTPVPVHDAQTIAALSARLTDKNAALVSDIVNLYIQYRSLQEQDTALGYFIDQRKSMGSNAKEDIQGIVQAKAAGMKESYEISLAIASKTGLMPEYISQILKSPKPMPTGDIMPVLGTSALALASSPGMQAIESKYNANPNTLKTAFSKIMIGEFFGVSGEVYVDQNSPWQVSAGTFNRHLNLSSILQDKNGLELKDDIVKSLFYFQGQLIRYSELGTQYDLLNKAYDTAQSDYQFLRSKYMDDGTFAAAVMETQKNVYEAKMAALKAQYKRLKVLVGIYSYFGVY